MIKKPIEAQFLNNLIWAIENPSTLQKIKQFLLERGLFRRHLTFGEENLQEHLAQQIDEHAERLAGETGRNAIEVLRQGLEVEIQQTEQVLSTQSLLFRSVQIVGIIVGIYIFFIQSSYALPCIALLLISLLGIFLWEKQGTQRQKQLWQKEQRHLLEESLTALTTLEQMKPGPTRHREENRINAQMINRTYQIIGEPRPKIDVFVLCPRWDEFLTVRQHLNLSEASTHPVIGTTYTMGTIQGKDRLLKVAVQETGAGNRAVRSAAELGILLFDPTIVLLVGKAAGLKDSALGDLVIGKQAFGYETGKMTPDGFVGRIKSAPYSHALTTRIQSFAQSTKYLFDGHRIHFGPIASGEKVIADANSPILTHIKSTIEDTLALEMEAIGFAEALQQFVFVQGANIRGISDFADQNKSKWEKDGSAQLAIERAVQFAFTFLQHMDWTTEFPLRPSEELSESRHYYYIRNSNVIHNSQINLAGDLNVGDHSDPR